MTAPHDRPCAAAGLLSYRYRGRYGWVMIGATDDADALREAGRSVDHAPTILRLERYVDGQYSPVVHSPK
jgi:hypothetical protein